MAGIRKPLMKNIKKDELENTTKTQKQHPQKNEEKTAQRGINTQITFKIAWRQEDLTNISDKNRMEQEPWSPCQFDRLKTNKLKSHVLFTIADR